MEELEQARKEVQGEKNETPVSQKMFKAGDKAFIVESNRFIREVTVKSCAGEMYLIKFEDGGGIKVKEHRMFKTKEDAEASIPKEKSKKTRSPYDYM